MSTYSKTIYVEVEAPNEADAETLIYNALCGLVNDAGNEVSYIDYEGPIEETAA